jgi:hypothetical protein
MERRASPPQQGRWICCPPVSSAHAWNAGSPCRPRGFAAPVRWLELKLGGRMSQPTPPLQRRIPKSNPVAAAAARGSLRSHLLQTFQNPFLQNLAIPTGFRNSCDLTSATLSWGSSPSSCLRAMCEVYLLSGGRPDDGSKDGQPVLGFGGASTTLALANKYAPGEGAATVTTDTRRSPTRLLAGRSAPRTLKPSGTAPISSAPSWPVSVSGNSYWPATDLLG